MPFKDRDKRLEYTRKYNRTHLEVRAKQARLRRAADPASLRNKCLVWRYGITTSEWEAMFVAQGSKCAICACTEGEWHTDHDHVTKELRSILCRGCNLLLGYAKDSPARLLVAAAYLERFFDGRKTRPATGTEDSGS